MTIKAILKELTLFNKIIYLNRQDHASCNKVSHLLAFYSYKIDLHKIHCQQKLTFQSHGVDH